MSNILTIQDGGFEIDLIVWKSNVFMSFVRMFSLV